MKESTISEYHCCGDCKNKLIVPVGLSNDSELVCLKKNPNVNRTGGLSKCIEFKKNKMG